MPNLFSSFSTSIFCFPGTNPKQIKQTFQFSVCLWSTCSITECNKFYSLSSVKEWCFFQENIQCNWIPHLLGCVYLATQHSWNRDLSIYTHHDSSARSQRSSQELLQASTMESVFIWDNYSNPNSRTKLNGFVKYKPIYQIHMPHTFSSHYLMTTIR